MKKIFSNLNLKKKLGLIALVLGFFAIFAGSPYKKANITINAKNLALIAEKQVADVTPEELADWIIKGNYDFRVIDTRNRDQYNEYHIPVAQNISVADLMGQNFLPTEKIILYSNDEVKAAQAWFLLKAKV